MQSARVCFIGLGGNLDAPAARFDAVLARLDRSPGISVRAVSGYWRSPAWGPIAQPDYLNAVAQADSALAPDELLRTLLMLEREFGRERSAGPRYGPRTIDLDLLLVDALVIDRAELSVPHPRLAERAFVLAPLAELAPDRIVPGLGCVRALWLGLPPSARQIERVGDSGFIARAPHRLGQAAATDPATESRP